MASLREAGAAPRRLKGSRGGASDHPNPLQAGVLPRLSCVSVPLRLCVKFDVLGKTIHDAMSPGLENALPIDLSFRFNAKTQRRKESPTEKRAGRLRQTSRPESNEF